MVLKQEHVIVVGAGLGGLATAMQLAHAGVSVVVLERASTPGGKMRVLPSVAGPVDTGPTVMTMRGIFDALFADCGTALERHVTLTQADVLARHWWHDGSSLDLHADRDQSIAAVKAFAGPQSADEFVRFCERAEKLFKAFDRPMMRAAKPDVMTLTKHVLSRPDLIPDMAPLKSLRGMLNGAFSDPRLRQLFGRYATYVGGMPGNVPAILSLIWHSEASGVWHLYGGMHKLAQAMARVAEQNGATFRYDCHVAEILGDGEVTGVRLNDGQVLPASKVVFNGDPAALQRGALGSAPRRIAKRAVTPRSLSAYVWAFAAKPSGRALAHHNVFFGRDPQSEFNDLSKGKMPQDPTLYVCAQDRGGINLPSGAERFEIIMNGPPISSGAVEEYETCQTRTFQTLKAHGLTFSDSPDAQALTTPAGFADLFPESDGSLYGRSPSGMMAAFHRPTARTKLPGLYLAGGGAHPGAGIPMATLSGRHAAAAILSDLASTSASRQTATHGGMSMGSVPTKAARSASSGS